MQRPIRSLMRDAVLAVARAARPTQALVRGAVLGSVLSVVVLAGCVLLRGPLQAPEAPTADCATAAVVGLRWSAPARGATPAAYRVFRDGEPLVTTGGREFADTSVVAGATYRYWVSSVDVAGNAHASAELRVSTAPATREGDAPYCPSPWVTAMTWDWAHAYRAADGSDLWPVTWAEDGSVYAFFGDGGGFGGDNYRGRTSFGIARITGRPPLGDSDVENVYGGFNTRVPSRLSGKARALLAVGVDFYAIASIYEPGDARAGEAAPISGSPDHLEMLFSPHGTQDWQASDWKFCGAESQPASKDAMFCPSGFVNAGPGNRGTADDYVYLFGSSPAADARAQDGADVARTYLARVDRRRLLSRSAYEYFAGVDAKSRPRWTADVDKLQPVFVDRNRAQRGCAGQCKMSSSLEEAVYDAGLRRYIGVAQGDLAAQTSFYDAPHPWGPWTTLGYHNIDPATGEGGWGALGVGAGESLGVHPVNAWTSRDGRTLWMVYSSDGRAGANAHFPAPGTPLDGFHLVRVDLQLGPRR
jgi:hypothetical protein